MTNDLLIICQRFPRRPRIRPNATIVERDLRFVFLKKSVEFNDVGVLKDAGGYKNMQESMRMGERELEIYE